MRILQVHTRYRQHGGEEVVVATEADALRAAGHRVTSYQVENPEGAAAATALLLAPWNPVQASSVRRLATRLRPDIAHVHNTWFAMSPAVLAGLHDSGVPVVLTLHNYRLMCCNAMLYRNGAPCELCVGTHPWYGVRYRCYRGIVGSVAAAGTIALNRRVGTWERHVDLFIAPTEFARQRFIAGGLPPDRIVVKSHFVADPGRRTAPPSASSDVLFAGRLTEEKGVGQLLEAWDRARLDGLRLVVVGAGPLRPMVESARSASVAYLGRVEAAQVRQLMLSSRALVFPSRWYETQGLVLLEAFAAGLPIIASGSGAGAEVTTPLGSEWLVRSPDPEAWAKALNTLLNDASCNLASSIARATYEEHYTPSLGVAALEACYERAVSNFRTR